MFGPSLARRAKQWSSTLNLPRSTFPPRPLATARPAYIAKCTDELYQWQYSNRPADNQFVLHDGPPYANGDLHIGHALNKILKDIICRFHISQGRRVQYIPGWDCHGLPIEVKALKGEEDSFRRLTPIQIRHKARALAQQTIEVQKQGFRDWAVLGDWQNAYNTMSKEFELRQLRVFKDMVEQGIIYRQFKPVHWSPSSGTALAEAELEYDESHQSTAAYVKFKLWGAPSAPVGTERNIYAIIWTTTPWTIPANRAIGIHRDFTYCLFRLGNSVNVYLVGKSRLDDVLRSAGLLASDATIVEELSGKDILNRSSFKYMNPFRPTEELPFLHGDFVSGDSGTGLVHMAPGHGFEDYTLCQTHNIEPFAPVDDMGQFTAEAFPERPQVLAGLPVLSEGAQAVLDLLSHPQFFHGTQFTGQNLIWATHKYIHKYPIDWRTKLPTIIRATAQWFANVESIKTSAIRALDKVEFLPKAGRARLHSFVTGRSQWCISRQRVWGVSIPALYAEDGTAIMNATTVEHIIRTIEQRGIDAWWTDDEHEPAWIHPTLLGGSYRRGKDTMDVWFDSGTTWSLLSLRPHDAPADVYLEGTDQHRGWFQSSLLTHVANQLSVADTKHPPHAPFKTLITHGFTLDERGRKMSKSIGNVISPHEITNGTLLSSVSSRNSTKSGPTKFAMGPDALRLWVDSSDYTRDVIVGDATLASIQTNLQKYRVTIKWLLGILEDYGLESFKLLPEYMTQHIRLADRIAMAQLLATLQNVHTSYSRYDFVKATNAINAYVNIDLSASYFETAKDHLYCGGRHDRLRVQHVCFTILKGLLSMLGPSLPLLVTEALDHTSAELKAHFQGPERNPLLNPWKTLEKPYVNKKTLPSPTDISILSQIHSAIKSAQETARLQKRMRSSLESHVTLSVTAVSLKRLPSLLQTAQSSGDLADLFVVSSVSLEDNTLEGQEDILDDQNGASNHRSIGDWSFNQEVHLASANEWYGTIIVKIGPPRGEKCPRCWKWTVETHEAEQVPVQPMAPEAEHICNRCTSVMNERYAQRQAASTHV